MVDADANLQCHVAIVYNMQNTLLEESCYMLDLGKQNQCPYLNDFHKFSCFVKLFELMMVASVYLECEEERRGRSTVHAR